MSIILPEIEYVDRATESIRYLEHGWPTGLCRWHAHEEYEVHLIVRTRGKAFVGDYIGEFEPGSLYLTGPNLPHNWITHDVKTPPVPIRDMLVQFNNDSFRRLERAFPEFAEMRPMLDQSLSGLEFVDFDPTEAKTHMENIRDMSGAERILAFLKLLVVLNTHPAKQVLSVTASAAKRPAGKHARIARVVDHIVEHYTENLSVDAAASMAGMSPSTFSRNFQMTTGNKFVEFINRVRIGQACGLLYSTDNQVSAICYEVGFQNLANFNRQFLKMKGMTPSAYRDTARRELAPSGQRKAEAVQ